jgi:uncharacterized protein (TIGR03437 family)
MVGSGWICATGSLNGCNRGDSLPAGQSYPPITVTVSVSPSAPSTLTNIATATGGGTSATVTASDPTTIVAAGSPAFSITKSHSGNFIQGQQGVYAISLRNTGTAATSSGALVEVVDDPPAGMTVISMAGSGWTCTTGSQNVCNRVDSLPSTQSYPNITVTVRIASDAPVALTNLAAARGGGTAGVVSATDPTIIAAGGAPRLSITKSHSGSFTQGQQGTYTIAVSNTGTAPTSAGASVQVVETPPAGMTVTTIAGSGWNCGPFSSLIGCSRTDSLPAGQSYAAITVNVSIAPNAPSSLTNVATVTGGGTTDTITATDQTTISTPSAPILSLTKSHNGSFTQGQEGIYTIRLRNTGMGATPSGSVIQVFENPPTSMTVISMVGQGWVCDVRLQNACTRADSLSAGQSYPDIAVTVRVAANAPSSLTNVATASGGGTSGTVSASDPTAILPGTGSILTPTAGTRQFAGVNSPFATPLQVTLSNGGAPVSGAAVTFKAPLTGASGTWAGSTTVTATTDASGRAVAPIFTANPVGGTYGVTATTGTVSTVFTLTNTSATTTTTTLVSPHSMGFNFTPGGPTTLTKSITISNSVTGSVPITYRVLFPNSQAANWLSVAPASLTTPAVLRVTADSRGFPPGRYLALIVVSAAQRSTGSAAQSFTPTSNLGTQVLSPEDVASDPGQAIPGTDHVLAATMVVPGSSPVKLSEPRCIWMSADTTPPAANRTPEEIDQDCSYRKSRDPLSVSVEASANTATDFEVSVTLLPNETDWLTARLKENPFASGTSLTGTTVSTITVDVQKDLLSYDTQLAYIQITNGTRGSDVAMVNAVKGPSLAVSPAVLNINADGSSATAVSPDAKDIGGSQKTATSTEQNITVSTSAGTLPFTVSSDVPWLSFRPASGTASPGNPVSIAVSADTSAIGSSGGGGSILIQRTDSLRSATAVSVIADRAVAGAPVITSVLNGASFQSPGIAPGSWVTIKGTGLSNTDNGRIWIASDFIAGKLPLSLDGVSVTINGVPAYVEYVSPTQLNVLAPGESARGEVAVIVKNNGKASAPVSAQMQTFSPAFFQFGKYAIAQRIPDLALLGNPALGSAFLSAKPGDIVTLWVTGLGPTAPAGQEGMLPTGGAAIANAPTVQLGGKALPAANVLGSAISSFAGAYQVAIRIPEVIEEGDVPITISVGGFASPEGVFLHVKK